MYLYPLLAVLAMSLAGATWLAAKRHKQQRAKRQAMGLMKLRGLRKVLASIQQHRGLSTGYLNGGIELLSQIEQVQRQVNSILAQIAAVDPWITGNERWPLIKQHWTRVAQRFVGNNPENNLVQHDKLVQNILFLIDDMAHEHDLLLVNARAGVPLHFAWRELLTAAECMGQARALGMAVVARRSCDTVSRIRLNFLSYKIEHTVQTVWAQLPPSREQRDTLQQLLHCIAEEAICSDIRIEVNDFFVVASAAIDSIYQQFDSLVE